LEPSILARSLWSFLGPWNFGSSFCGSKVQKSKRTWTKTMHYIVFLFFLLQPNRVYAAQGAQESCMIVSHPKSGGFRVITFSIQDAQLVFDLRKS
jgi:hypothetical protein